MTIPPLVTRTKRMVDVLKEGRERSVRSLRVVQSDGVACSFRIWEIEQQRVKKKNALACIADILSCRKKLSCDDRGHC